MKKKENKEHQQLKFIDKATEKALKQVERERNNDLTRNYIVEWFRWVELSGKELSKHIN